MGVLVRSLGQYLIKSKASNQWRKRGSNVPNDRLYKGQSIKVSQLLFKGQENKREVIDLHLWAGIMHQYE